MGLGISSEDFIGRWSLSFSDTDFVNGKPGPARLGLALQLKFFAAHGFFVQDHAALPADGVLYLAEQLGLEADAVNHYDFSGRTARRHCAVLLNAAENACWHIQVPISNILPVDAYWQIDPALSGSFSVDKGSF